jgi:hypothetical protein
MDVDSTKLTLIDEKKSTQQTSKQSNGDAQSIVGETTRKRTLVDSQDGVNLSNTDVSSGKKIFLTCLENVFVCENFNFVKKKCNFFLLLKKIERKTIIIK